MRFVAAGVVLAMALSVGGIANADVTSNPAVKLSDERLIDKMQSFADQFSDGNYKKVCAAVPYYEELARRNPTPKLRVIALWVSGICDQSEGRNRQALTQFGRAENVGNAGDMRSVIDFQALAAAYRSKNWDAFADHAVHIALRNDPEEFADLDENLMRYGLLNAGAEATGRVAVAFAAMSSFDKVPSDLQEALAYQSVRPALAADDTELALRMALKTNYAPSYVKMLVNRQYEAIWPQLEQHAGPSMKSLTSGVADAAVTAANAEPENLEKLSAAVNLLNYARRFDEVVLLAQRVNHAPRAYAKITEYGGWVLNAEVEALDALGRHGEADVLFERLTKLSPDKRDWIVNFVINRADRLVTAGRWAEALPASELAVSVAAVHGTPYAREAAVGSRLCAAYRLDPARDLSTWWKEVDLNWEDNIGSAVNTALCLGKDAVAKRYLNEGAKNPKILPDVLLILQPPAVDFYMDTALAVKTPYDLRRKDSEIEALLNQHGRELPKTLWPNVAEH